MLLFPAALEAQKGFCGFYGFRELHSAHVFLDCLLTGNCKWGMYMVYKGVVKKEKVKAIIRTANEKIEGTIFKLPQNRLLDMLNHDIGPLIPVTSAKAYHIVTGELMFEAEFIAINNNSVVLIADHVNIKGD